MNDRKLKILFSIIDSYILDGEPIGSKSLADTYNLNVSPATVRNEMSSLEKMGLIEKAHSSSGRLPSDRGYRMFVDYILENEIENISKAKKSDTIINLLDKNYHNAEDIVETATKMLADLTELTAVSMTLKNEIKKIVNMELIQLSDRQLLLLAVFDNGLIVKDSIYLDYEITSDELIFINNALKKTMVGTDINEVYNNLNLLETTLLNDYKSLIEIIEKRLQSQSFGKLNREIQIEGLGNIFNFKEYDDLSKTRDFIKLLDSKEKLNSFLGNNIYDTLDISIGYENELDELKQNTVITSSFKINDDVVGHIGVIGLTRLNYIDVISDIMMISRLLNDWKGLRMDEKNLNDDKLNKEQSEDKEILEEDEVIDGEIVDDDYEAVDEDENEINNDKLEEDFNEFKDKYQRLLADFTNYKQREEASKADFKKYAVSNLVEKLLPVLDNFDRALKDQNPEDGLVKGILMTRDEMLSILKNEGLEEISSDGELFDPNIHQAVLAEDSDEVESDHIIETFQKGYKLNNRVIRPAMVKVAK